MEIYDLINIEAGGFILNEVTDNNKVNCHARGSIRVIGQVTFFQTLYGAILQCAALQRFLNEHGFDCELIQYSSNGLLRQQTWWRRQISIVLSWLNMVFCRRRVRNTRLFSERYIQKTRKFHSEHELQKVNRYDAYIAGSDQIWNPRNNNGESIYFLDFAASGVLRIAYAPSFGVAKLSEKFREQYRCLLKKFDSLSAREVTGATIIQELFGGQKIPVVLDPTFLVDAEKWRTMAVGKERDFRYVVCYQVGKNSQLRTKIQNTAKKIAKHIGGRIIWIGDPGYMRLKRPWSDGWDAGPAEFLHLIDHADFVVTNSFHALAFSLIFHKEFLMITRSETAMLESSLDSRQRDLLHRLHLDARWITSLNEDAQIEAIDYEIVEKILEKERAFSRNFLLSALRNPEEQDHLS